MKILAILSWIWLAAIASPASAAGEVKPALPDPAYCSERDADPEKCVIQDGPPLKPIVRKKPPTVLPKAPVAKPVAKS